MRGNPPAAFFSVSVSRSIPARAGEPQCRHLASSATDGLSPRVRGNLTQIARERPPLGSIPARAGNHRPHSRSGRTRGSIPARAGEPDVAGRVFDIDWVYPRACGGTANDGVVNVRAQGLSPRVRGNRHASVAGSLLAGSIPARAGEPLGLADSIKQSTGLSPRVRGNHATQSGRGSELGSIPARAGEPNHFPARQTD